MSIKILLSTLPNKYFYIKIFLCKKLFFSADKSKLQQNLLMLETRLEKLNKNAVEFSIEKFALELCFNRTEIRPFSIILFCDTSLVSLIDNCIDPITKHGLLLFFIILKIT